MRCTFGEEGTSIVDVLGGNRNNQFLGTVIHTYEGKLEVRGVYRGASKRDVLEAAREFLRSFGNDV